MFVADNINDFFEISDCVLKAVPRPEINEKIFCEFKVPKGVRVISSNCFIHLPELTKIILSNDVETVEEDVFGSTVKEVKLGKNIKNITPNAFRKAPFLKTISVNKNNPYFQSSYGMLFNKNEKSLIYVPHHSLGRYLLTSLDKINNIKKAKTIKDKLNVKIDVSLKKKVREYFEKNVHIIAPYALALSPDIFNSRDYVNNLLDTEDGEKLIAMMKKTYDLHWTKGLKTVGTGAFKSNLCYRFVSFEEGLETIDNFAFVNCTNLEIISIPKSVKRIGRYAFWNCKKLYSLHIPDSVYKIEQGICKDCYALQELSISEKCTVIEDEAFLNCKSLMKFRIPNTVESIGSKAFAGCEKLELIVPHLAVYADDAFEDCRNVIFE